MSKKGKKPDAKELEALRIAEEERKAEEERRLLVDRRKTEAPDSGAGLPLLINEYCIEQLWDERHPHPKEFLLEFITRVLKDRDVLENFEPLDLSLLVEFNIQNLIYVKDKLKFDNRKATIAVNILWNLLINNNILYQQKVDWKNQSIQQRADYLKSKTEQNDLHEFKRILKNHGVENPLTGQKYLETGDVKEIVEYAKDFFFMQYNLFKFALYNQQSKENERLTLFVENPIEIPPLSHASHIQKDKEDLKFQEEIRKHREVEEQKLREDVERLQKEEEERLRLEEEERNRLDEKTLYIIQQKVKAIEEEMQKELDARAQSLNEKLVALEPKKKK